ncbi:putative quinate utilization oxidoreductase QutH [Saccharata proteae CBS 121410]|uniref:Quinate utilization oxidoreductase QutH n=1 Tax=Saccharata proteae CBS 121410 TaxID=1314787 RepID=A0A9P4LXG7_9PEZI|nr:putative quinate utilization oxidoreductase QutH [Saccharata proteae CBS 121410]
MASKTILEIAVMGAGGIGPRHAQAITNCPSTSLSCLVDPNPSAQHVAERFHTHYCPSVQSMLASRRPKPSAAIVCTPNETHVSIASEILNAGIPVICEKPLSTTVESGQFLVKLAADLKVPLLAGHHRRFHPIIRRTKSLLPSLGRVITINGLWALYKPNPYFDAPTQWRREVESGGPVFINLVHEVDVLQYLFGPIDRVMAEAVQKTRPFDVDEGTTVMLRFASGVVGTFVCADNVVSPWAWEMGTGENPTIPATHQDSYRILGTTASLSAPSLQRWSYADQKTWTEPMQQETFSVHETKTPFEAQIEDLVAVVRGEKGAECEGMEGLRAVRVVDAVLTAMRGEGGEGLVV